MAIHWIRGFRRLGWVLVVLASPAVFLVAREYSKTRKYDAAALQSLYPDLPFTPEATARALDVENEISSGREVAQANRNWYSENRWKLENLRTAGKYPKLWEGLSERTDWLACCAYFAMGLAGLTVITQGGISLANWIIAGFRSPSGQLEAAKPKSSDPGTVQVVASIPNLGGSTLALLVGGLLILAGVTKASSKNTALEAGLVIVFGACAYRSAKRRVLQATPATARNVTIEALGLLSAVLIAGIGLISRHWYEDPVPFLVIPIWVFAGYFIALRRRPAE